MSNAEWDRKPLPPIPAGMQKGWGLRIDDKPVDCRSARLDSKFGTWSYGMHPHGYDGWWFAEFGGGGVITLPYSVIDDILWVGLIEEDRPNLGGETLCAIGGYLDENENPETAARREAFEETGLSVPHFRLAGVPAASNRALFVADHRAGEGVKFYAAHVPQEALTPPTEGRRYWSPPRKAEVGRVVFMDWRDAVMSSPDALALAAIARLLATVGIAVSIPRERHP